MSSKNKNLSEYDVNAVPDAADMRFGIVVSEWNKEITFALCQGAIDTLKKHGAQDDSVQVHYVPGSFELPVAAQWLADTEELDAVICIGCVIQGETRHFEFICNAVSQGITNVSLQWNLPVIFGVLTPDNWQQALDRAGGKHGNKGDEAAITAIKMVHLQKKINNYPQE